MSNPIKGKKTRKLNKSNIVYNFVHPYCFICHLQVVSHGTIAYGNKRTDRQILWHNIWGYVDFFYQLNLLHSEGDGNFWWLRQCCQSFFGQYYDLCSYEKFPKTGHSVQISGHELIWKPLMNQIFQFSTFENRIRTVLRSCWDWNRVHVATRYVGTFIYRQSPIFSLVTKNTF